MARSSPNEWFRLLSSWSDELLSTTDRVRNLIGDRHQPTKGSYLESLLRRLLRRVLPARYRVSTGFIYRWDDEPSRQIDVLIWDAQEHSSLLEEGELVVLPLDAVTAIIEVKSCLNAGELRSALSLLSPPWLVSWRHTSESSEAGLLQQTPTVPFRGLFSFTSSWATPDKTATAVFSELADFYREQFGADAERALAHSSNDLYWANMVDAVCVADQLEIEQTRLNLFLENSRPTVAPAFAAFLGNSPAGSIAVGKFCMFLLLRIVGFRGYDEPAARTVFAAMKRATPGVCAFGEYGMPYLGAKLWGDAICTSEIWTPTPPLWSSVQSRT